AGQSNYAASKAGVIAFTRSVAKELAGRGVTANVIAPGWIETDMTAAVDEKNKEATLAALPLKRLGTPEDVAGAAVFLASDAASYVTAQTLVVDGGLSA
ncbi:MAG: SDR family oxidoreductase, partial [Nitrospira sp.]|nr:SDR family oxidoreductase [Nitrospira sp.]